MLMDAIIRRRRLARFSPAALFGLSDTGWFYDPNDLSTMFQESTGVTPADFGLPVGLQLDKSKGLVLGPELVTNGDFSNGSNSWASGSSFTSTATVENGEIQVTPTADFGRQLQTLTLVVGRTYQIEGKIRRISGASANGAYVSVGFGSQGDTVVIAGSSSATQTSFKAVFVPTNATVNINLAARTGNVGGFDNISVRELPGNHRSQTVSNNRPILGRHPFGGIRNLLGATATLATQTRTVAAVQHTLSFRGTGTVTLTGASTAGPLVGTGANDIVSLTFTPTAGSLTLTVSGTVNDAQLEQGAARSNYQLVADASGFNITEAGVPSLNYLAYNGTSTSLSTSAFAWGTDKATVVAGVRKLSDAGVGQIIGVPTGNGRVVLEHPASAGYQFFSVGTLSSQASVTTGFPAPISNVLTGIGDISGDRATLRINGAQVAQSTADQGTGNFGTHAYFFGARAGTSLYFVGREYPNLGINRLLTANELAQLERFTAQRTGIVI